MRLLCMTFPPNKRAQEATEEEQMIKIAEEYGEFRAATHGEGDPIEECIDSILAHDGWLDKQPTEAVHEAITKVLAKGIERGDWSAYPMKELGWPVRCRDCKHLGRATPVAGEYRCNRTERMTTLDDFCSRAVRRDA